jgi:hypothetical protein
MPDSMLEDLATRDWRARDVTGRAAQALARLLELAEGRQSGQARVAISSRRRSKAGAIGSIRSSCAPVNSTSATTCCAAPDALRWGRSDLYRLVPHCEARVRAVVRRPIIGRDHG